MNFYKFLVCLLVSFLTIIQYNNVAKAQNTNKFIHLTSEDGLIDDVVFSIFQDSQGYIWIGTAGGLQKFDGYNFTTFKQDYNNVNSKIQENVVRHITETSDGTILIGTRGGGISRYKNGNLLSPIRHNPKDNNSLINDYVEDILEDKEGGLWIATREGLDYLKNGQFTHFKHIKNDLTSLSNNNVFSLCLDHQNNLWVGTVNGLNKYIGNNKFQRYINNKNILKELVSDNQDTNSELGFIHDIILDSKNNLWIAKINGGIEKINLSSLEISHFQYNENISNSLGSNIPLALTEDFSGNIWASMWGGGINKISTNNKITVFKKDSKDKGTILSDNVEDIITDKNGNIWSAGNFGSVSFYKVKKNIVNLHTYTSIQQRNKSKTEIITSILKYSVDSSIWLGSERGIDIYKNDTIIQLSVDQNNNKYQLGSNRISSIFEDSKGRIWISYLGYGVDLFENGVFKHFPANKENSVHDGFINKILEDKLGRVWFSSEQNGISYLHDNQFYAFKNGPKDSQSLSNNQITDLGIDSKGNIWIATRGGGLCKFDSKTNQFITFKNERSNAASLPKNIVENIVVDHNDDIWVSYGEGVSRLNQSSGNFIHYSQNEGLTGAYIEEMILDFNGDIWIASHNGAALYDETTNRFKEFSKRHGFTDNKLKSIGLDAQNKKVLFSGLEGLFELDATKTNTSESNVNLNYTNFKLNGNVTDSLQEKFNKDFSKNKKVELPYYLNSFELSFSALSSEINPDFNYYYRIKNLSEEWIYLGNKNYLSFTEMADGFYNIEVKIVQNNLEQSQKVAITILPPWWKTNLFRFSVLFLLLFIIVFIIRYRIALNNRQKEILEIKISERTEQLKSSQQKILSQNSELQIRQNEIVTQNEELKQVQEELQTQRDYIEKKNIDLEEKNRNINYSIMAALEIQKASLPSEDNFRSYFNNFFIFHKPRDIVSGDFYWLEKVDNALWLIVADCTGHGIPGAFMSLFGKSFLDKLILQDMINSPSEVLVQLDLEIRKSLKQDENRGLNGMDISIVKFKDIETNKSIIEFSAARNSILILKNNELIEIKGDKASIGGYKNKNLSFTNHEITLGSEDIIYLSTDGYKDQNNFKRKSFSRKRFYDLIYSLKDTPLTTQKKILEEQLNDFMVDTEQRDDILVLGLSTS